MVRCPTDGGGNKDEMKMTFIAIIPVILRATNSVDVSSGVGAFQIIINMMMMLVAVVMAMAMSVIILTGMSAFLVNNFLHFISY